MKKLLIIFIILYSCNNIEAQVATQKYSKQLTQSLEDLVYYYDQYSKICYNDSVKHEGYVNKLHESGGYYWSEYEIWYEHKQPTLDGFIIYLKTLIK